MKKNMKKEIIKKSIKRMDLLEHLKMSLFNFNFNLIYIIHKMLALIRNNLNYLKDSIFECFFRKYNRLLVFIENDFFFITYNNGMSQS